MVRFNYDSTNVSLANENYCSIDTLFPLSTSFPFYDFDKKYTKHLFEVNGKLFVSSSNLTQINGVPSAKFGAICLPPSKIKEFNNSYNVAVLPGDPEPPKNIDTLVCDGNIKAYGFSPVSEAVGYKYTIYGEGINYNFGSSLNNPPSSFISTTGTQTVVYRQTGLTNQIWLEFTSNFTSGMLKVEPFSLCNNVSDYVFGKPIYLNLYQAPLPNLTIPTATTLNCIQESVTLTPSSSTSNVSFSWYNVLNAPVSGLTQTVHIDSIQLPYTSKTLYVEVQETTGNQCKFRDTVVVYKDVREPSLIKDTTMFGMWNCYTDSMLVGVIDINNLGASLTLDTYFIQNSDTTFSQSGYVQSPDLIVFKASYLETGCIDSLSTSINTDLAPPAQNNIFATVDGVQSNFLGLDVLNCSNDSSLLVLSDTVNYDTYWIFNN
ncbi:MAG: hypothetical protein ACOVOV_03465, partial [Dolichospermum sp.]